MTTLVVKPSLETDERYWDESGAWNGSGLSWFTAGKRADSDPQARGKTWGILYFRPADASLIGASFLANTKMRLWAAFSDTGTPCPLLIHTVIGNPAMPTSVAQGNAILASNLSTASVAWSPVAQNAGPPRDILQTPDLSPILNEWASQAGMDSTWPLGFVFVPNNIDASGGQIVRTWRAHDADASEWPELTLEYSAVGLPTISSSLDVALSPTAVTINGTNLANTQAVQIVEEVAGGNRIAWKRPYASGNPWTEPISTAIQPHSSSAVQNDLHKMAGIIGHTIFTATLYFAKAQYSIKTFTITQEFTIEGVPQSVPGTIQVRIPDNASYTQHPADYDRPMLIIDQDEVTIWEIYHPTKNSTTSFSAPIASSHNLETSRGYFEPYTRYATNLVTPALDNRPDTSTRFRRIGSTAAGLSWFGGLVKRTVLEEALATNGDLGCAFGIALDPSQRGVGPNSSVPSPTAGSIQWGEVIWPASVSDTNSATMHNNNVHTGALIYLPTSVNVEAQPWTAEAKVIARTFQRYGGIVRDTAGGGNKIYAASTVGEESPTTQQVANINANIAAIFDLCLVAADDTMLPATLNSGNKTKGGGATLVSGATHPDAFGSGGGGTVRTDFTSVTNVNSTQITATTPVLSTSGVYDFTVTTTIGESVAGTLEAFDPPTITSLDTTTGNTSGGTTVIATGTNFRSVADVGKVTSITVGGNPATGVTVLSDTTVRFQTPAGTAGAKDVVLTTPGGSDTLAGGFEYITADTTVTPGLSSLALTGYAPTVTAVADVTVTPNKKALAISRYAPVVTVVSDAGSSPEPAVASLVATPYAPSVQLGAHFTLPGRGPISVTISL